MPLDGHCNPLRDETPYHVSYRASSQVVKKQTSVLQPVRVTGFALVSADCLSTGAAFEFANASGNADVVPCLAKIDYATPVVIGEHVIVLLFSGDALSEKIEHRPRHGYNAALFVFGFAGIEPDVSSQQMNLIHPKLEQFALAEPAGIRTLKHGP